MLSLPISLTDLQIDEVPPLYGDAPDRAEPAIRKLAEECPRSCWVWRVPDGRRGPLN